MVARAFVSGMVSLLLVVGSAHGETDSAVAAAERLSFDVTQAPFAAKADGKTNDTKAIQAAIDACDAELGGTIYFPPGRYLVDSVVLTRPNLTLRGDGALLIKNPETPDHVFKDTAGVASGLSCYGLKFDLSRPSFKLGNAVSAFFFIRANDLRFVDCEFTNGIEEGLKLYKCQNVIIDRCRFENIADGGVQLHAPPNDGYTGNGPDQDSANTKITRCTFKDIDDGLWGAGNGCGVQMYSTSKNATTRDVLVQGNTFYGCLRGVWSESQQGLQTRRLLVQDNIFVGQYTKAPPGESGGQIAQSAHGVGLTSTVQGAIAGNTFYNIGTFAADPPTGTRTSDVAAIIISGDHLETGSRFVRIADNIILDDRGKDAKMDYGIIVRINTDISIGENQIEGARLKPINIEQQEPAQQQQQQDASGEG
jgi:polygalacturonase